MPSRVLSADSLRGADTLERNSQLVPCWAHLSVCLPSLLSIHPCLCVGMSSFQGTGYRVQGPGSRASEYVKFMPRHPAILELVAARLIVAYACCLLLFRFRFRFLFLTAGGGGGGNLFDFAHSWRGLVKFEGSSNSRSSKARACNL